jgi:hypothetical protein
MFERNELDIIMQNERDVVDIIMLHNFCLVNGVYATGQNHRDFTQQWLLYKGLSKIFQLTL